MRKILRIVIVSQIITISGFSQTFSLDLSRQFQAHNFELPEKEVSGFRFDAIGFNYPFFDFPFFKFASERHSVNTRFKSVSGLNFGLEYISNIPIFNGPHLIGGLYFLDTDFNFTYKKMPHQGFLSMA